MIAPSQATGASISLDRTQLETQAVDTLAYRSAMRPADQDVARLATRVERFEAALVEGVLFWVGLCIILLTSAIADEAVVFLLLGLLWVTGSLSVECLKGWNWGRHVVELGVYNLDGSPATRGQHTVLAVLRGIWIWPLMGILGLHLAVFEMGHPVPNGFMLFMHVALQLAIGFRVVDIVIGWLTLISLSERFTRTRLVCECRMAVAVSDLVRRGDRW